MKMVTRRGLRSGTKSIAPWTVLKSPLPSRQRRRATRLLVAPVLEAHVEPVDGEAEAAAWIEHQQRESADASLVALVSTLPTNTGAGLDDVARLARECGIGWAVTGRAALGLLRVGITGEPEAVRHYAEALRAALSTRGGHVQFTQQIELLDRRVDPFGPVGSSAAVGFAVKQRFDPAGVLPYPWARS